MSSPAGWHPDPDPAAPAQQMRYWDGQVWTEHVASPQVPTPYGTPGQPGRSTATYRSPRGLARWAIAAVLAVVGVRAAIAFSVDPSFDRVQQAAYAGEDLDGLVTAYDVLNVVHLVALVVAGLVSAAWLYRSRVNAEALVPAAPHRRRRGWAWGAWVCPVVSFWFPFQVVRDVSRATREGGGGLIGLWWAGFLVMELVERAAARATSSTGSPDTTWDDYVSHVRSTQIVALVITGLAAAAWVAVVRRIEGDQEIADAAATSAARTAQVG